MSLYDRIYLKTKCPYCRQTSRMEFQTKEGDCYLHTYRKAQKFDKGQFRVIDAIGTCQSPTCQLEAAKENVWKHGYYGGFSRNFDAKIYCDSKGRITGKIKITHLDNHKGTMYGKLGELKGKEDNMIIVQYSRFNKKQNKWQEAKLKPMTTNGWLDKFQEETDARIFGGGKKEYEIILYIYNLEDGEEAFRYWFALRYKLKRIVDGLRHKLKLKKDEEFASLFLSNYTPDIVKFVDVK